MSYIECKEPGCTQIISSPCTPVNVLFGINALMQAIKEAPLKTESQANVTEQLEKVKTEVQNDSMWQQELKTDNTKNSTATDKAEKDAATSKVIVLECILKHRHTYLVNCS